MRLVPGSPRPSGRRRPGKAWQGAVAEARAHLARAEGDDATAGRLLARAVEPFTIAGQPLDVQRCLEENGQHGQHRHQYGYLGRDVGAGASPERYSRLKTASSPTIWSSPWVRPKKNPAKATQNTIWAGLTSAAPWRSNAPGWNSMPIIAVTSTGEPSKMASVSRLRASKSALHRVSSHHCRRRLGLPPGHCGGEGGQGASAG